MKLRFTLLSLCLLTVRAGAAENLLPPEKTIIFDPHVAWVVAPNEGRPIPRVYGIDEFTENPRFLVGDPNFSSQWYYRPMLYIDLDRYPILKLKYRAKNISNTTEQIIRLKHGTSGNYKATWIFTGKDLVSDGQAHELTADLRQLDVKNFATVISVNVDADDKGQASFELDALSFSIPTDAKEPEKMNEEPAIAIIVTDDSGNALQGAKVTLDAERLNFARSAITDAEGKASLTPLAYQAVDTSRHMVRVEKQKIVTVERGELVAGQSSEPVKIKTIPGTYYGSIAKTAENQPLRRGMVSLKATAPTESFLRCTSANVVTDEAGQWIAGPFTDDASQIKVTVFPPDEKTTVAEIDPGSVKHSPPAFALRTTSAVTPTSMAKSQPNPKSEPTPKGPTVTLRNADDKAMSGWITGLSDNRLAFALKSGTKIEKKEMPLTDVVEIVYSERKPSSGSSSSSSSSSITSSSARSSTKASSQPAKPLVCKIDLNDGDHMAGAIKSWSDKKIIFAPDAASGSTIELTVDQIKELWAGTADQVKQAKGMKIEPGLEDTAFVSKDKEITSVRGVAIGMEGDSLKFRYNDEDRKIAIGKVVGIVLGGQSEAKPDNSFHQTLLTLNDDIISGKLKSLTTDNVELQASGGTVKVPLTKLAKIEFRNGRLVYLGDIRPAQVQQTPYFDRMLGFRINTSLNGSSLQLSDGPTTRGVAVHSHCVLKYDLGGKFDEFKTKVGFQQPEGKAGQAVVRVMGDDKVLWENPDARGDAKPQDVSVKLAGVNFLVLEVDFGKGQDVGDRVVWANPRLLRAKVEQ